jgi:hypothetical protein
MDELYELDPTNIDLDIQIRDLNREVTITVRALDDKTFTFISAQAQVLKDELNKELKKFKDALKAKN